MIQRNYIMLRVRRSVNSGKYTVDRFEGELAVLLFRENESIEVVEKRSELPQEVREGDILYLEFAAEKLISAKILEEETMEARNRAQELLKKLRNK